MSETDSKDALVARVRDALREVIDPELGINVVDLGLVYRIEAEEGRLSVAMTMTTPACPLGEYLSAQAEAVVRRVAPEVPEVRVQLVWDPPWSPDLMSPDAKLRLGWGAP
jgi:metal-sulfur cluster biosynthetic enzyme